MKCPYLVKCCPKLPPFSISASNNFPRFSSIGAIIFSSDNSNASCSTYITAPANFHNPKYFNSLCTTTKAVEAEESVVEAERTEVIEGKYPLNAVLHISKKCCTFARRHHFSNFETRIRNFAFHQHQAANWTLPDPSADCREVLSCHIHPDASHRLLKERVSSHPVSSSLSAG